MNYVLKEEEIIEKFIHSSGPGGQNVNKTATCIYLKHLPTGIEVKCQSQRSQAQNRVSARKLLEEKVKALFARKSLQVKQNFEKTRRRNRLKPRKLKLKILENKRKHSVKKAQRRSVRDIE